MYKRVYRYAAALVIAALAACSGHTTAPTPPLMRTMSTTTSGCDSSISANFNGTPIQAGSTLWFSAVMKVSGVGTSPVTLNMSGSTISFTASGTPYTIAVPNSSVKIDPGAGAATISSTSSGWTETVPYPFSGNVLLDAVQLPVSAALPGGIQNVTWAGHFTSPQQSIAVQWAWSAAVYKQFASDYNSLGVKPVDANNTSQYLNSDHAGTPENYKSYVTGGATGGGGSNYTGGLSGTGAVNSCVQVVPSGTIFVSDYWTTGITEYAPDANGNAAPVTVLTDPNATGSLALDKAGYLYAGSHDSIAIFPPGATGAAPPSTVIAGPNTGLSEIRGIAVDKSGNIWVSNWNANSVTEYAAGASGDATPIRTIVGSDTGLNQPAGLTFDANGDVFVSSYGWSGSGAVFEYASNASGDAIPIGSYQYIYQPQSVLVDAKENLYVGIRGGVYEYPYTGTNSCLGAVGDPCGTAWGTGTLISTDGGGVFDSFGDLVLDDVWSNRIDVLPPGSTAPSRTISTNGPASLAAY